ncbi:hypothetical protein [Mesorhizobium sp. M00.F.Ca.ET.217.01.1.1]|uniref:hypothetical protein n=1 Tax=Mesorhizobium sp. M00.F.Ca.ET.217.01.1.1 TaxID=2500529 RepID=UPI000FDCD7FF|nr:hypothetical protein [Mesorhizobium sp. M00.F.Ca.ET.217.01.1.1]TGQ19298.1 hypothetical protein EN860_019395 [Mesorhizobium sp. M00.F.Ca.ET.217.01.1.1]
MKVLVGGTPLESMGWQRDLGKVRMRWRDAPKADRIEFLEDLVVSAHVERWLILQEEKACS